MMIMVVMKGDKMNIVEIQIIENEKVIIEALIELFESDVDLYFKVQKLEKLNMLYNNLQQTNNLINKER